MKTAPSPDPNEPRPSAEEWAVWAENNLPPEDAKVFLAPKEEAEESPRPPTQWD